MKYEIKEFDLKGLDGISDEQISAHRDVLYAGYVNKLNEITEGLGGADLTKANQIFSHLRSLKAEESFALNGVVLHELYFGNLGGDGKEPTGQLHNLIARDFGPFERWVNNFKACGLAARGWVILGLSGYDGMLHNYCLDSHNTNFPALCTPLLVMDVYEHAYAIDYGVKRAPYIESFMGNINWETVVERLEGFEGKTAAG